jgi:hypothetical protein
MVRWMLQITAMLSDILIAAMCILALWFLPLWISAPAIYLTYRSWRNTGGLVAWTHRKEFMENAKQLGL